MAKTTKQLTGGRTFSNLKKLQFTPWVDNNGTLQPGDTTYDLVDIVADTTTVEQEDNEVNTIEHEFSGSPLVENISLGKKTFTAECIDMGNEVLQSMFGWTVKDGHAFAPKAYKPLYCTIEMQFNSTDDAVILPKVLLNSKAVFASMKTDVSRAAISGTCYSAYVTVGTNEEETDMAVVKATDGSVAAYTVSATAKA